MVFFELDSLLNPLWRCRPGCIWYSFEGNFRVYGYDFVIARPQYSALFRQSERSASLKRQSKETDKKSSLHDPRRFVATSQSDYHPTRGLQ
jgi:hypothetical protein